MRRALLLVVAMCAVSVLASAQAISDEQAIRQIEQEWDNAAIRADTAALDQIYADDCVFTTADGQIFTKTQMLAAVKSGERDLESATVNEMKVRILGDMAIVHGLSTFKRSVNGKDVSGQYRWTDIFAKRGGRWQAVAVHASRVAAP